MRRGLRFSSCRYIWQQSRFRVIKTVKDRSFSSQQMVQTWGTRQSQMCFKTFVRSLRFFSQDKDHKEDLEENQRLLSSLPSAVQTDETAPNQRNSPFSHHLQRCGCPSDVLDLTCQYAPTVRQVCSCLTLMWTTTKKMTNEQRLYELQLMYSHPAFDRLLQSAMKSVGHMRTEDIAYSLIAMVKLGVPQRSRVLQTFLRHCQVVNENLSNIMKTFFSFLICCVILVTHLIVL